MRTAVVSCCTRHVLTHQMIKATSYCRLTKGIVGDNDNWNWFFDVARYKKSFDAFFISTDIIFSIHQRKHSGIIIIFLSSHDHINPDPQQSLPIYIIICIEITIINDGRRSRYGYIYLSKRISKIGQNILAINRPNRTPKIFFPKKIWY